MRMGRLLPDRIGAVAFVTDGDSLAECPIGLKRHRADDRVSVVRVEKARAIRSQGDVAGCGTSDHKQIESMQPHVSIYRIDC